MGEQPLCAPTVAAGADYQGALPAEFYVVDERPPEVVFREGITPPRMVTGTALPHDLVRHAWAPDQEIAGFVRAAGSPAGALRLLRGRAAPVWVYRVAPGPDLHQLRRGMGAVGRGVLSRHGGAPRLDAVRRERRGVAPPRRARRRPATRRLFAGLPPAYEARLTVEFVARSGGAPGDIEARPGPHLP